MVTIFQDIEDFLNKRSGIRAVLVIIFRYFLPFFSVPFFALIKLILDPVFALDVYLLMQIPVFLHAWIGHIRSGLLSLGLSIVLIWYFFANPARSFELENAEFIRIVIYLIQSFLLIYVVSRLTRSRKAIKYVKESIDKEKKRLKDIIDSLFTFVLVITPEGRIIEANKATTALGSPKSTIIGKNIIDTYPWSYSNTVQQKLSQSIVESLTGKIVNYDEKIRVEDDKFIDVFISIVPVSGRKAVDYIILSATDISDRKEYEQELERIHQNYYKLVNSNIIGMVIGDQEGNFLETNEAFLNIIGYSREDVISNKVTWKDLITFEEGVDADPTEDLLDKGFAGPIERAFKHKSGSKVPVIISSALIDEDGTALSLVLDITERKKLERKKDEFISIASHELKTPLTTLKGYVQLLETKLHKRQEENVSFVEKMDKQLLKLTELINDLLDISRIQSDGLILNKTRFNITELVEEIIQDVLPLTAKHRINLFKPSSPQMINGDRIRLGQVITNILTNAIKYSPEADRINVYIQDYSDEVRVMIEDFGIGIPNDKIEKLFQKFYRIEENQSNWHQGLGLGLYISNEILKRHGSVIHVKSDMGKGSIFYFNIAKANG